MKLTPWFDASVTPHRTGVYECDWRDIDWMGGRWFNEWDGKQWRMGQYTPRSHKRKQRPVTQDVVARALRRWRGVLVTPNVRAERPQTAAPQPE